MTAASRVRQRGVGTHRADGEPLDVLVRPTVRQQFSAEFRREVADRDARELLHARHDAEDGNPAPLQERQDVRLEVVERTVHDAVEHDAREPVPEGFRVRERLVHVPRFLVARNQDDRGVQ
jgi:hypothetical protein